MKLHCPQQSSVWKRGSPGNQPQAARRALANTPLTQTDNIARCETPAVVSPRQSHSAGANMHSRVLRSTGGCSVSVSRCRQKEFQRNSEADCLLEVGKTERARGGILAADPSRSQMLSFNIRTLDLSVAESA